MNVNIEKEITLLCSHSKLERDKGCLAFDVLLSKLKNESECSNRFIQIEDKILLLLEESPTKKWEEVFGVLEASKLMIKNEVYSKAFPDKLLKFALQYLEHDEFRVRIVAGELLGSICKFVNIQYYKQCEKALIENIKKYLQREIPDIFASQHIEKKDAKDIFHDTEGWKCLETSMKGLQAIIDGCGKSFLTLINFELLNLLFETLNHTNRFVRETGYYVCASLARYGATSEENCNSDMVSKLAEHLSVGLADNWSQVRLSASVATRQFFEDINEEDKRIYLKLLLPPMCLNRYYLAEGVKLYSQESWKLILGNNGKQVVEVYIKEVVDFYIKQTECDNHAVREAACHCIAELALKISTDAVRPYTKPLLDALHVCFQDESWPVRDTACLACGNFVSAFPDECKSIMVLLYPLFFANLSDPIPSVRQGAATALSKVANALPNESNDLLFSKIQTDLNGVEQQKATSERYEGLDKGVATYGVIKQLRDNDFDLHSNQQMYSCGSLAPKMKRGGGCMDHSFKRKSELWEAADGSLYLVSELSKIDAIKEKVETCLPLIIKACHLKHYTHYLHFYESVNKVIPILAENLGKRVFKRYIEEFFEVIFTSLTCENALTKVAASECLAFLSKYLGPNILRGRIEQFNSSYLQHLDDIHQNVHPFRPY